MRMRKNSQMLLAALLLVAASSLPCTAAMSMQSYTEQGECQGAQICQYSYSVEQQVTQRSEQRFIVTASVEITCNSVGVFNGSAAQQYCMTVRDTQLAGKFFENDTTDELTDKRRFLDQLLSGWFCFVQTESGKVAAVYHASGENPEALNIKKAIAAAFQANFRGTAEEEEQDQGSMHNSHYQYIPTDEEGVIKMHRTVGSDDVTDYNSGTAKKDVRFSKEEDVEYHSGRLYHSGGSTSVNIKTHSNSDDPDNIITSETFSGSGSYSLDLKRCFSLSQTVHARQRRSVEEEIERDFEEDSLKATIDEEKLAEKQMQQIRDQLPSVAAALQLIHDDPEQHKIVELLQDLLVLEAQYGTLPQFQPALTEVMDYFFTLMNPQDPSDVDMRIFIFSLLRMEGSLQSQMLLANGLDYVSTSEEKSAIIVQIAFIENPRNELVAAIEEQLSNHPTEGLLLSYGALASEASPAIKARIISFLLQQHTVAMLTNNTNTLIHIMYALGNTGAEQILPTIFSYINSPTLELQLAAINSLTKLTHTELVQDELIHTLITAESLNEKAVSGIAEVLVAGAEYSQQQDISNEPKDGLITALVSAALLFNNTDLHELVSSFLHSLGTETALTEMQRLQDNRLSKTRKRRDHSFNWNAGSSLYDLVASQSSRSSDEIRYPQHRALIWGKKIGIDEANIQLAAGVFFGLSNGSIPDMKAFGKAVVQGNVLDRSYTFANAEFLLQKEGSIIRGRIYARIAGNTLVDVQESVDLRYQCLTDSRPLFSSRYRIFSFSYPIFIYVGVLRVTVYMDATFSMNFNQEICGGLSSNPQQLLAIDARAGVDPTVTATVGGSASASLAELVEAGVSAEASLSYTVEPEGSVNFCYNIYAGFGRRICTGMYGSSPNNRIELYAWWRTRTVKWCRASSWLGDWSYPCGFTWGSRHRWDDFSTSWSLPSSSRRLLYGSCNTNSNPQCVLPTTTPTTPPTTPPTPTPTTLPTIPPTTTPTPKPTTTPTPPPTPECTTECTTEATSTAGSGDFPEGISGDPIEFAYGY